MSSQYWILKGTTLITNTKKQRLKIQSRGQTLKNTILKQNKITKIIKYKYMKSALKFGYFSCKVIVGFKNEN